MTTPPPVDPAPFAATLRAVRDRSGLSQAVVAGRLHQIDLWYRSDAEMVAYPCVYNVAENGRVISAWEAPLPAVAAWLTFLPTVPDEFQLLVLIFGLIAMLYWDLRTAPAWYRNLRIIATAGATVSLFVVIQSL